MSIIINVQVVPFGNVILQIGSSTIQLEKSALTDSSTEIYYQEPVETASNIYEFLYEQPQNTYVAPPFTSSFWIFLLTCVEKFYLTNWSLILLVLILPVVFVLLACALFTLKVQPIRGLILIPVVGAGDFL